MEHGRKFERAAANTPARISQHDNVLNGTILNLSVGGAFIALDNVGPCRTGEGVRLSFRLLGAAALNLYATTCWCRPVATAEGPAGLGVQFFGLGRAETHIIEDFVRRLNAGAVDAGEPAVRMTKKYHVAPGAPNQPTVEIQVHGSLNPVESQELATRVADQVAMFPPGPLLAFIDARNFAPCSDESLGHMQTWLGRLARGGNFAGILLGSNSVGMLQFRRLAREAGVADSLLCVENEEEARDLFGQMQASLAEIEQAG